MDDRARLFIERATLLFIASRNAEGKMDVSPRGGQPVVVRLRADGSLLLPDYVGNRRLDTIGNVLSNPEVALLLLNRFNDEYLRISAKAAISRSDSDIAAFPADENRPLSVMVLTPSVMEFIKSSTFARTGFWVDPDKRKPPLDLMDIYLKDTKWQAEGGRKPVARDAAGEQHLADTGLRDMYGTPSIPVQTKVYNAAGPGGMAYLEEARFIVFAREDGDGRIALDLVGGVPLRPDPTSNEQSFLLVLPRDQVARSTLPHSGECALLAVEPGRCENMRMNGIYGNRPPDIDGACKLSIRPEEIYFHCSAAFARSRIWTDSRPIAWSGQRSFTCAARKRESPDVVSFVLKPRDDAPIGPVVPGQYVTVLLPKDEHQPQRRRCYSVSRTPASQCVELAAAACRICCTIGSMLETRCSLVRRAGSSCSTVCHCVQWCLSAPAWASRRFCRCWRNWDTSLPGAMSGSFIWRVTPGIVCSGKRLCALHEMRVLMSGFSRPTPGLKVTMPAIMSGESMPKRWHHWCRLPMRISTSAARTNS